MSPFCQFSFSGNIFEQGALNNQAVKTMKQGNLTVHTENIFPIIKKFLYSDHAIFLRELISNAVDATQKLKTLASSSDFDGDLGDLTIKVEIDAKKKTLTIKDHG